MLFVELPSSGARCTLFCYQTPGAVSPAARACTVQRSTGCCRWTARVASTACRIRRRTPGRRRYARWQRSARLRGRYQASFSGQAYVRTCGLVHMFFEASVYTCFSGASPPFRREAPLCRDRVAVGRLRLPARSAQSGASLQISGFAASDLMSFTERPLPTNGPPSPRPPLALYCLSRPQPACAIA